MLTELGPGEAEHEDRVLVRPLEQVVDEIEQTVTGPLQVLEDHHHRLVLGEALEEHPPAREQLLACQARLGDAEQSPEPRDQELAIGGADDPAVEARVELRDRLLEGRFLGDPKPLAHHLRERPIRDPVAVGQAASGMEQEVVGQAVGVLDEFPTKPRLADAGRPGDRHQTCDAMLDAGVKQVLDQSQVGVAPHQRRLKARFALLAADAAHHSSGMPQVHRLSLALEDMLAGVLVGDRGRAHLPSDVVDQHLSGLGRRLNPRGCVDPVSDHDPLPGIRLRGHLARYHRCARSQPRGFGTLAERGHRIDDLERGSNRALGVVLTGPRHAPDGHHRVANELLDRASVPFDDRSSGIEIAGEQLAHILGVARLSEAGEVDEVDEQDGCHAQLCRARRCNSGVRDRRGGGGRRRTECRAAFFAELLLGAMTGSAR